MRIALRDCFQETTRTSQASYCQAPPQTSTVLLKARSSGFSVVFTDEDAGLGDCAARLDTTCSVQVPGTDSGEKASKGVTEFENAVSAARILMLPVLVEAISKELLKSTTSSEGLPRVATCAKYFWRKPSLRNLEGVKIPWSSTHLSSIRVVLCKILAHAASRANGIFTGYAEKEPRMGDWTARVGLHLARWCVSFHSIGQNGLHAISFLEDDRPTPWVCWNGCLVHAWIIAVSRNSEYAREGGIF